VTNLENYQEGVFSVVEELADLWTDFCFEQGADGCEVLQESDGEQQLKCYLTEPQKLDEWISRFRNKYPQAVGKLELLEYRLCPNENWRLGWHDHFQPVAIGRTLLIVPVWYEKDLPENRQVILLEPGQAFGTGTHVSTRLALEMLELVILQEARVPASLIDIGTGSGILSLAATRLGISKVVACDNDPVVLPEAYHNFQLNQQEQHFWGVVGMANVIDEPAPLVISNMLLQELQSAAADLARLTATGGTLICSGLLTEQEAPIGTTLAEYGLQICATTEAEGWSAFAFREAGKF
jgi:ribosomal protein L11 methyltransferase